IELQLLAQDLNKPDRLKRNWADLDRLLRCLALRPGEQVLTEKEHEEDEEPQRIQSPEQLAAEDHPQRHACNRPDARPTVEKLATPGAVVQQWREGLGEW